MRSNVITTNDLFWGKIKKKVKNKQFLCCSQSSKQTVNVRAHSHVWMCLGVAICEQMCLGKISDMCARVFEKLLGADAY